MTANFFDVGPLPGELVTLLPLRADHVPGLVAAAAQERERYVYTDVPSDEAGMRRYIDAALDAASRHEAVPFAMVGQNCGSVVGTTRFCRFEYWHWRTASRPRPADWPDACQIGYTWLARDAQGTGINSEAKLLMMRVAFERWRLSRVTFRTDARNVRSRSAIERLGACLDGVLRSEQAAYDGGIRDTAWYSVLDREWADVQRRILASLDRRRTDRRRGDGSAPR